MPDDESPIYDWTDPRWPHTPTRPGIPYPVLMTPQGAAKILNKAAAKKMIGSKTVKSKAGHVAKPLAKK